MRAKVTRFTLLRWHVQARGTRYRIRVANTGFAAVANLNLWWLHGCTPDCLAMAWSS